MSKVDFNSEGTRRPPLVSVPFDHDPHRRSAVRWHELWSRGVQHGPYCNYCSSINKKTWASLRGYLVGTQQQIAPRFLVGGLGRPGFCPAAMAAAMDEGLEEIKHESVDLVRIDSICVFFVRLWRFPLSIDLSIRFAVLFLVS